MSIMPHEVVIGDVYFPPLLLVAAMAYILTGVVTAIGTRIGLHKYVAAPAIVELSMVILFIGLISQFISIF
ncbi:DUF1656 domain-containing protein [Shewanella sp. 6_MG-2023]|uniref:DUF1656 domain-containing protein n=1 Tax=Shewanella sp. 6_MG-2023 TaxID=3062660 RepID=UPI0026E13384|nr:DUF1656 domain-containing protein [Shewanella sp. 6_MG-2023]MDO6618137.1 DUF1656 domain-containing protein [Shewanella sp. 6_MG-2023]